MASRCRDCARSPYHEKFDRGEMPAESRNSRKPSSRSRLHEISLLSPTDIAALLSRRPREPPAEAALECRSGKLDRARSRLYRSQIFQENMRLKALAEIYTMHSFAQLCNLKILSKISLNFAKSDKISFYLKILVFFQTKF